MEKKIILGSQKPIEIPKLKKRKLLDDPNMVLEITYMPDPIDTGNESSNFEDYLIVNDSYLLRKPMNNFTEIIIGGIGIILALIIASINSFDKNSLIFTSFIFIPSFIFILKSITRKDKEFILSRGQNLIKYPNGWWYESIVSYFDKSSIVLLYIGKYQVPTLKALTNGFLTSSYTIVNFHPLNYWSFMVWYMDKNRPLPPGNAFDEYRERDFQRRKAEGFPSPLYPSFVPTPEATPQQQAERDKYWEERFTTNENGETLRHFWERDRNLNVNKSQHN